MLCELFDGIGFVVLIDGFKNISLEEALKDSEAVGNIEINDSSNKFVFLG